MTAHLRSAGRAQRSRLSRLSFRLSAMMAVLGLSVASAHYHYDAICCSGRDCAPIAPETVTETREGFTIRLGPDDHVMLKASGQVGKKEWFIPRADAKKPLDFDFHACFSPAGTLLCFYARVSGS